MGSFFPSHLTCKDLVSPLKSPLKSQLESKNVVLDQDIFVLDKTIVLCELLPPSVEIKKLDRRSPSSVEMEIKSVEPETFPRIGNKLLEYLEKDRNFLLCGYMINFLNELLDKKKSPDYIGCITEIKEKINRLMEFKKQTEDTIERGNYKVAIQQILDFFCYLEIYMKGDQL